MQLLRRCGVLSLALVITGCGGSSGGSTPTTPTPTTPAPTTPPPTTPAAPTLVFTAETSTPAPNTYWLDTAEPTASGEIAVRVNANFAARFSRFRGTILYDPAVLTAVSYAEADYMKQGGALTDTSVTVAGNRVIIRIDRPDSLLGASGFGTVLFLRFTPASGVRAGTSPLQWTEASAFTASSNDLLTRTYGGSITIR